MIMEVNGIGNNNPMFYITDWNITPGYHKFEKHRFPQGYIELMPWFTLNWKDINQHITGKDNIIFINTPVGDELAKLKIIQQLIPNNKVFIIQEGNFRDWYEWSATEQELYIECISTCTAFMCNTDVIDEARVFAERLLHGRICTNLFTESPRGWGGEYVFLINPIKRFQTGMIAHKLVRDSVPMEVPVFSMKYTRPSNPVPYHAYPDSYKMPGFTLLDRCSPDEWLGRIYNCRFGVDIARDYAGGNSALEFASLGIPLIGNIKLESQSDLFPDVSFEYNDSKNIKNAIKMLLNDKDFYNEVATKAHNRAINHWNSHVVVNEFKENLKVYLNGRNS